MVKAKKNGLVGQFKIKCHNCEFELDLFKLFEEVDELYWWKLPTYLADF